MIKHDEILSDEEIHSILPTGSLWRIRSAIDEKPERVLFIIKVEPYIGGGGAQYLKITFVFDKTLRYAESISPKYLLQDLVRIA